MMDASSASIQHGAAGPDGLTSARPRLRGIWPGWPNPGGPIPVRSTTPKPLTLVVDTSQSFSVLLRGSLALTLVDLTGQKLSTDAGASHRNFSTFSNTANSRHTVIHRFPYQQKRNHRWICS
jgi:hypothetical protein